MKVKSVVDSKTFRAIPQDESEQVTDFMKYAKEKKAKVDAAKGTTTSTSPKEI